MRNLIAAVYFFLAMFGWDIGGTTIINHTVTDGLDRIHSRIRIQSAVTRFECVASASGECHHTLFPRQCASATGDCNALPAERFAMAAGSSREVVGMPGFNACVALDDTEMAKDCTPVESR